MSLLRDEWNAMPRATQPGGRLTGLLELPDILGRLTGEARVRADRLLDVRIVRGRTDPPPEMNAWLERTFGSVEAVRDQTVVKVLNLATLEATVFAPLRARRPLDLAPTGGDLAAEIEATEGGPFCHPGDRHAGRCLRPSARGAGRDGRERGDGRSPSRRHRLRPARSARL